MSEQQSINLKKYRFAMLGLLIVVEVIAVLFVNSIKLSGQKVTSNAYSIDNPLINIVGYDMENWVFTLEDAEEPYITYKQDIDSDGSLIVFDDYQAEDTDITIWYMDSTGLILKEFTEELSKDERILFLQNITPGTSIISLGIPKAFSLYEIIQTQSENHPLRKMALVFMTVIIVFSLFALLYKKRFLQQKIESVVFNLLKIKGVLWRWCPALIFIMLSIIAGIIFSDKNITLFGKSYNINYKTIYLLVTLVIVVYILIRNKKWLEERFHVSGALVILLIGSTYVFVEPACNGVSWDDEIHYRDASSLSHLIDGKKSQSDKEVFHYYQTVALDRYAYDKETSVKNNCMYDKLDKLGLYYEDNEFHFSISKLVYIPISIGLSLSRGAGLPYHICLIVGRLFNLLFYVMLCYYAMKKLKHGKIVVLLFALIPTNIFMAASYSYDPWLIGLVIFAYALIFSERERETDYMDKKTMILIPLALFLSTLSKLVYFVMAIPALVIPKERFRDKKQRRIYTILAILSIILPFVIMYINNIANAGVGDIRGGDTVNATKQIEFILGNAGFVTEVIVDFLKVYLNPLTGGLSYLNNLSYNGVIMGGRITLFFVLAIAFICHEDKDRKSFPIWYRICILLLYVGVGALCAVTMYISFTPVGANIVAGCQGRYLLPVIFPTVYVLSRIPTKKCIADKLGRNNVYLVACAGLLLINLFCIWKGCVCYYI